ncbi:MAG: RnfABCDGE type electron transport complex subunit D [Gammaproteobacteria bacterium]|nr:RnfABCDGE type electron transport complex subunit D [Gammaproteobacteria bacterium]MBU1731813.1 RnfABCDGE type electron transport complex subunit D [Gammaproteobacteria bacterium]MBU1892424.1 RnfABCDGE type electron transport complex subunit D [Gammaproteobacteria bacterium]
MSFRSISHSAPFTHQASSVQKIMFTVLLALIPATAFNLYLFGWPAILLFSVTVGSCVIVEAGCLALAGRPVRATLGDYSAVLTGWLLAMSLPPWAPWWIGFLGAIFAIALAKHPFGGIGQNVFNPAMVARVALLISFPVAMTVWVMPHPLFSAGAPGFFDAIAITFGGQMPDAVSAASALGHVKTELTRGIPVSQSMVQAPDLMDMMMGYRAGSLGETSAILILAGGLFLMAKRIISWHIPLSVMGGVFLMGAIFHAVDPARFASGTFHLLSGATFLGAFFIATDYVTSPVSKKGQLIFGLGCGVLIWLIRTFAGYPEGVAFAVLLMNALVPIIDQYTRPRAFGRNRKGEPLPLGEEKP